MFFHTIPQKKKKERKKKAFGHIPFPAAHGEGQTLSDISAGRQGGRFFPMGWRLPPYFQNTPLPKNTPSGPSSTKGALGVSKCPHPLLFLLHPVAWEGHKSLGSPHHKCVCSPCGPGSGLTLFSYPPGPCSKAAVIGGLVAQSCLTPCNPMDCSPTGSSIRGVSQARILEWVGISFSGDLPASRIEPASPCTAGGFFSDWATRETCDSGCPKTQIWSFRLLKNLLWPFGPQQAFSNSSQCMGLCIADDERIVFKNFVFTFWWCHAARGS